MIQKEIFSLKVRKMHFFVYKVYLSGGQYLFTIDYQTLLKLVVRPLQHDLQE